MAKIKQYLSFKSQYTSKEISEIDLPKGASLIFEVGADPNGFEGSYCRNCNDRYILCYVLRDETNEEIQIREARQKMLEGINKTFEHTTLYALISKYPEEAKEWTKSL